MNRHCKVTGIDIKEQYCIDGIMKIVARHFEVIDKKQNGRSQS